MFPHPAEAQRLIGLPCGRARPEIQKRQLDASRTLILTGSQRGGGGVFSLQGSPGHRAELTSPDPGTSHQPRGPPKGVPEVYRQRCPLGPAWGPSASSGDTGCSHTELVPLPGHDPVTVPTLPSDAGILTGSTRLPGERHCLHTSWPWELAALPVPVPPPRRSLSR